MNKFMQILYTLLSVAVLWACDGRDSDRTDQSYPLDAFSVKVGESWYHAVMDQENRTASFGSLKNGNAITDVRYTLQNAEATISPDPKEFIGKWSESQPVTVTVNGTETTYFIVFPDWDESSLDLLFVDEFDVDGEPDPEKWTLCEKGDVDWNNQMSQSYGQAPLGCAPIAYNLFQNFMKFNPKDPKWDNRDRFVLSAGHGSMLYYSLLYLYGYGLTKEDLMNFRQLGSKTPGHPEYGHTVGVETTTGPLGQGIANAVGMAVAEANLAAKYNKPGFNVVDHYTYAICGDGCLEEGISYEGEESQGLHESSRQNS